MFIVFCSNKECRAEMQPVLDRDNDVVLCTKCGKEINSVTEFAKRQMVALGQVKKDDAKQQAFAVECKKCNKKGQPKLSDKNELVCAFCSKALDLSAPFANSIRQFLNAQR